MLRSNCVGIIKSVRCGKQIRARRSYQLCRMCHKRINDESRPIGRVTKARTIHTKAIKTTTTNKKKK